MLLHNPNTDACGACGQDGPDLSVWLAAPDAVREFDMQELAAADRRRFDALRSPRRREEFAASRALLNHVNPQAAASSSLSHSGGYAALIHGPAHCAIGIDLEQHRARDLLSIARFAFDPLEAATLEALQGCARENMFYALWVMKEAAAKALRLPLLVALRACVFVADRDDWSAQLPSTEPWRIVAFGPRPGMSLAIARIGKCLNFDREIAIREWPQSGRAWTLTADIVGNSPS